jgi:hypothetical protein
MHTKILLTAPNKSNERGTGVTIDALNENTSGTFGGLGPNCLSLQ